MPNNEAVIPLVPKGAPVKLTADRFSVFGQEVSFLENPDFIQCFSKVIDVARAKIKDQAVYQISWRCHLAASLFSQATSRVEDIVYVECGTNLGLITRCILEMNKKSVSTFLFDTWKGIPEEQIGKSEGLAHWHNKNNYNEDVYDFVAKIFSDYEGVTMIQGKVPETLAKFPDSHVNFLHLDMNITYPEKAALEFFWPRLAAGGCLLIDDYGFAKHTDQRNMYDDFFGALGITPTQVPTGQAFVLKR